MLVVINIRHNFSKNVKESEKALNEFYNVMKIIMSNH